MYTLMYSNLVQPATMPNSPCNSISHSQQPANNDVSPVADHFNSGAHSESDMTVMVIELSYSRDPCLRKVKEGRWIRTLETSCPSGMNLRVDSL